LDYDYTKEYFTLNINVHYKTGFGLLEARIYGFPYLLIYQSINDFLLMPNIGQWGLIRSISIFISFILRFDVTLLKDWILDLDLSMGALK